MDFKQIEFFLKLYEEQNVTKAGKELYISQQGLSKSIRNLEKEIGLPLFDRNVKGAYPTEYAKRLWPYFKDVSSNIDSLYQEIASIRNSHKGELHLICAVGAMYCIPMEILIDFQTKYPDVKVVYDEVPEQTADELLTTNQWDVGLLARIADDTIFHSIPVYKEKICAYMHRNHPLAKKEILVLQDLDRQDMLFYPQTNKARKALEIACEKLEIKVNIIFETTNSLNMIPLLRKNKGIAMCIPSVFQSHLGDDIVERPVAWEDYWSVCIAWKKNVPLSMTAKLFLNFIKNYKI